MMFSQLFNRLHVLSSLWQNCSLTIHIHIFFNIYFTVISKKHFPLGGMATSDGTRYLRVVRDTPVADYSSRGINTTRRVAYRPPIAVSTFLLTLSFSYCTQTLWHCGQLWPYIGMGSLGTRLHRNCRCENLSLHSFYIKLEERRKKVRRYDTTWPWGSTQLHGSTKSRKERVRPKVGKDRLCIFVEWQDEMKMRCCLSTPGSPEDILRVAHSTSITHVSPYTHRRSLTIYLEAMIELVWRCTPRPRSSELRDALGGRDPVNWEMHSEAVIEQVWRCTWRPISSELRAALGGRDRASLEMHLEAKIEWTESCTWRPWSIKFGDALGGRDQASWELHLEAVIDPVWRCTWRPRSSALRCAGRPWSSEFGCALAGYDRARLEEYLEAVNLEGGAMATCCTWCMLYSVLTYDYGMER